MFNLLIQCIMAKFENFEQLVAEISRLYCAHGAHFCLAWVSLCHEYVLADTLATQRYQCMDVVDGAFGKELSFCFSPAGMSVVIYVKDGERLVIWEVEVCS